MTAKKRLVVLFTLIAAVIIAITTTAVSVLNVSANSDYAAMKGFNIEGLNYSDDETVSNRSIKYSNATIGNMSLWVGRYNLYNSTTRHMYVALFIEAKICASNNSARNSQMVIDVYHVDDLCSTVTVYYPEQSSGGSVTETSGFEFGISEDGFNAGFSFSDSHTYSEIDLQCESYSSLDCEDGPCECDPNGAPTGVEFSFTWQDVGALTPNRSPYHGEIIKRLAVVFDVDMASNPGFDSDFNTFVVEYDAYLYYGGGNRSNNITMEFDGRGVSVD